MLSGSIFVRVYGDDVVESCVKAAWDCLGKVSDESLKGVTLGVACDLLRGHEGRDATEAFEFVSRWWRSNGGVCGGGCGDVERLVQGVDFRRMGGDYLVDIVKALGLKDCEMLEIASQ